MPDDMPYNSYCPNCVEHKTQTDHEIQHLY